MTCAGHGLYPLNLAKTYMLTSISTKSSRLIRARRARIFGILISVNRTVPENNSNLDKPPIPMSTHGKIARYS